MSNLRPRLAFVVAACAAMTALYPHEVRAALTSVGNVYTVSQLTGVASPARTEERWNLKGTDEGSAFTDYTGSTLFAFGDSYSYDGNPFNNLSPNGDWRHNLIARSGDRFPSNGIDLDFFSFATANRAQQFISDQAGDSTTIPTAGVAVGASLYVQFQRIKQFCFPGFPCTCTAQAPCPVPPPTLWQTSGTVTDGWLVNGAGIVRSDDNGQTWGAPVNIWTYNKSNFTQGAFVPALSGTVYFLGIPAARYGCMKVAKTTSSGVQTPSSYVYWAGGTTWTTSELTAVCAVPGPMGEFSVVYNTYLQQYLLLYINTSTSLIEARTSTDLTSWSNPIAVPGAFFGAYAPMLIPSMSTGRDIYFEQSNGLEYSVFLTHATLNTTSTTWGPFDVPGHVEAENYASAYDTTPGNQGTDNTYHPGDVDISWRSANGISAEGLAVSASAGEWLSYSVNVTSTGTYKARVRYSSASTSCNLQIDAPGGNPVYVPSTPLSPTGSDTDFVFWAPSTTFTLNAGAQNINLYIPSGSCNVSAFEIYPVGSGTEYHLSAFPISYQTASGTLFQPMSQNCNTSQATLVAPPGPIANTIDDPLYQYRLEGPVSCALSVPNGAYQVRFMNTEGSKTAAGQRRFNVKVEGVNWLEQYDTFDRSGGQNIAKDEVRDIYVQDGTLNVDTVTGFADLPSISGLEIVRTDPKMLTHPVPGHVEAEDYRPGGQGVGYSDTTTGNTGGYYRGDSVDIRKKTGGGYQVGWTANQEWLIYDLNVAATGTYKIRLRYSQAGGTGCRIRVESPGGSIVYVPATTLTPTGSADTFAAWAPPDTFTLTKGPVSMSVFFSTGGCDVDSFDIYAYNCAGSVCCASSCTNANGDLQCGGTGCSGFPGGADRCCAGVITTHNFSCAGDPLTNAPCVLP